MINKKTRFVTFVLIVVFLSCSRIESRQNGEYTADQQLVIAAFELEVESVRRLLDRGADPNTRIGEHEKLLFQDKWTTGYPSDSSNWTPLMAVAHSHRAPQLTQRTENTMEGLRAARETRDAIDPRIIVDRDDRRVAIAKLLIAANADLDLDNGHGDTALSISVFNRYDELSLLLIESNAKIISKEDSGVDGVAGTTPVHRATASPSVLAAMIQRGTDVDIPNARGHTPLHWAAMSANVESVRLLIGAGADVDAKDNDGFSPSYYCRDIGIDDENKKLIRELLDAASKGVDANE